MVGSSPTRRKSARRVSMTIAVGDRLPDATFRFLGPDGIKSTTTGEVFGGKKVVLFAVPGPSLRPVT
jgi:peroxiredoxin